MSIRTMDIVWRTFPPGGSDLLAMLAMADWCDDDGGNLFPSIRAIAKRIRTSESQARRVVHKLIRDGWISVVGNEFGGAPGMTRKYQLNIAKLLATGGIRVTPRTGATPRANATPSADAHDGSHECETTGSTRASQTVKKQPSVSVSKKQRSCATPAVISLDEVISEGVERQHAEDWMQVRRNKRAPLTRTAWDDLKAEAKKAGITVADAVRIAATRSWQGFNASWVGPSQVSNGPGRSLRESLADTSVRVNREHDLQEVQRHERTLAS